MLGRMGNRMLNTQEVLTSDPTWPNIYKVAISLNADKLWSFKPTKELLLV